ncbi:hypothetical protein DL98DRAFT_584358 [Cadophora sp. DSE1049]|nr:hypothetical protein DL98DRAFT_584358 [Cadophora sp. DSE1049]
MLLQNIILTLFSLAIVITALEVIWPTGYIPTEAEAAFAANRSAIVARGEEVKGALLDHVLPLGCVQAHCGSVKGTTAEIWKTFYEITVEHNGRLMFHLLASSSSKRKWDGIRDLAR